MQNNEEGKEDHNVGRSAAVGAIIPELQDVATPQYRRTAHDSPSLSHPRRICSPFWWTRIWRSFYPLLFYQILRHYVTRNSGFRTFSGFLKNWKIFLLLLLHIYLELNFEENFLLRWIKTKLRRKVKKKKKKLDNIK